MRQLLCGYSSVVLKVAVILLPMAHSAMSADISVVTTWGLS